MTGPAAKTIPATYNEALVALQASLPEVTKDKVAKITSKRTGDTHKYSYANLPAIIAAIKDNLAACGLAFNARPTIVGREDGQRDFVLAYTLRHVSGVSESGEYPLPDPARHEPQVVGSAITYARRYCLGCITGVVTDEDDDGQTARESRTGGQAERRLRPVRDAEQPGNGQQAPQAPPDRQGTPAQRAAQLLADRAAQIVRDGGDVTQLGEEVHKDAKRKTILTCPVRNPFDPAAEVVQLTQVITEARSRIEAREVVEGGGGYGD